MKQQLGNFLFQNFRWFSTQVNNISLFTTAKTLLQYAAVQIGWIKLENASDTYSKFNSIKFDLADEHDRFILYSAFTVWICKGSSIAPLANYTYIQYNLSRRSEARKILYRFWRKGRYWSSKRKAHTEEFEKVKHDDTNLLTTVEL